MKFIIRDDDTCGFTRVDELENCYKNILPEIPVSLSITPFRISREGDSFSHNNILYKPYPLEKNEELVSFLKEKIKNNQVEAALHGYHHFVEPSNEKQKMLAEKDPRFLNKEYLYGNNLVQKTRDGKKYLEELLDCKVTTFVPPSNSIGKNGIKAIEKNNLNLVTTHPLWDLTVRPFKLRNFLNLLKKESFSIGKKFKDYPFIYDFKTYKEVKYHTLGPSSILNNILQKLKQSYTSGGIFVLATHYQSFHLKIKSGETIQYALNKIIDEAYKLNSVEFTTYRKIWK